jgi:cell division septation protein DedD
MASLNPFGNSQLSEPIILPTNELKPVTEAITMVENIDKEITPIITQKKKYYIIAGAFSEKKNANKLLAKLKKWNYNTELVPGGNLLRVSYDSFSDKANALIALHEIKYENADAWLLTQ